MNPLMFYIALTFAVLALGFFAFIVGGKSAKAKTQRELNDEFGYNSTITDMVKMTAASIVVSTGAFIAVGLTYLVAPASLAVPISVIGDPASFLMSVVVGILIATGGGFLLGASYQDKLDGKKIGHNSKIPLTVIVSLAGIGLLVRTVSAEVLNMTDTMTPITEIMGWAGTSFVPAVIVLFMAVIPLIMVMMGVRFAGGMLSGLMEGIRDIFTFKF